MPLERIELEGRIESLSASCPSVTFRLEGQNVFTLPATEFKPVPCGLVINGTTVKLTGRRMSDGRVRADEIEMRLTGERVELDGRITGLVGSCPVIVFRVDSRTVLTSKDTKWDGRCDRLRDGREVEVEGRRLTDGRVWAEEVEIDDD